MSHVFARHTALNPPVAKRGVGVYIVGTDGRRWLDACGGAAVSCLGHSDAEVAEAVKAQLDALPYAHTSFFTSEPAEALADWLVARAPPGLDRVLFVTGGSEAIEAALKLARQYFLEIGAPQRRHVIARWQSYHGNTLGALAAGGNRWRRMPFEPLLAPAMSHVDPCHHWRFALPDESPRAYGERLARQLEEHILELGPETVAAFVAEPVVGATMGAVTAVPGYFERVREVCDRHGVLLVFDEVMCGMGRTGTLFASEQENVAPDIVCIAKSLSGGIQPLGAMLVSQRIHEAIARGSGFFQHGHTYLAHPAACAAGLATVRAIESRGLLARVRASGDRLMRLLHEHLDGIPAVGDIRGRGLFVGIELVAVRTTREPFDPSLRLHAAIKRAAFDDGLMVYPMGGTVDGHRGDHVLLAPPYIVDDEHLELIARGVARAIVKALALSAPSPATSTV